MSEHDRPIFVYGTLRWQCGNDTLWHGRAVSHHDGTAYVVGFRLVSTGGFPYMIPSATSQTVGALIVPNDGEYEHVLRRMDALEGYEPDSDWNHYERITVPVFTPSGIRYAWTYVPAARRDERTSVLPDVPTNEDGFFDWRLASRRLRLITERN